MTHTLELEPNTAGADDLVLRGTGDGRLVAVVEGAHVPVRLRQCFPWSEPHRHLSLRDAEDREVALVEDPAALADAESRGALEAALAEAVFVLEVTRVAAIEEEVEIRHWRVETKQGPRVFQTHLDDWPRTLPLGGLLIRDVAGDLYRLEPERLDARSQELLWAFVD